jgi:hypothetical protein
MRCFAHTLFYQLTRTTKMCVVSRCHSATGLSCAGCKTRRTQDRLLLSPCSSRSNEATLRSFSLTIWCTAFRVVYVRPRTLGPGMDPSGMVTQTSAWRQVSPVEADVAALRLAPLFSRKSHAIHCVRRRTVGFVRRMLEWPHASGGGLQDGAAPTRQAGFHRR